MASLSNILQSIPSKVFSFIAEPLPAGIPPPPEGLGYEVAVNPQGEPYRTGQLIPTGRTEMSTLQIALNALGPVAAFTQGPTGIANYIGTKALTGFQTQLIKPPPLYGGSTMSFADGDSGYFGVSDVFSGVGQVLQGQVGRDLLQIGTQALSGYVQQQFAPQAQNVGYNPLFNTQAAAMPVIVGGMRSLATRFPNLAAAIAGFAARGIQVTRSKLWSLMKRFGPDFLVTGGILSAAAISELMISGPGRRRMNPGNVKALRKAHRRMTSFHKICVTNDRLLGGRRKGKSTRFIGGTSITQVK